MANTTGITAALEAQSANADDVSAPLFPLPFTPFEFYYLLEDRADFPSVFPVTLECRGTLDRAALAQAYQIAHARHPFLSAQINFDLRGWPFWTDGEAVSLSWTEGGGEAPWTSTGATDTGGVRLRICQDGDRQTFQFIFHHVAVDGMGAFLFIADLFLAYAHFSSGEPGEPELRPLQPQRLRDRDGHHLFNRKVKLIDLLRLGKIFGALQFSRPAVVVNHDEPVRELLPADTVGEYLVHHLTEAETAALSRVARVQTVMLHDLLLRDYFLTLEKWNRGTREGRRPIRMAVPTNLRRREDYRMPAANVFSLAFITRKGHQCERRAELLTSIRDEMATIKSQKRGLYFEAGLRISSFWPTLMRWSVNRKWPFATAVFTNLGTGLDNVPLPAMDGLKVCGDLTFEGGAGAGPLRPDTRVSIAVHTYAGRMAICLRCDPSLFSLDQQRAILDSYIENLRTTIETAT
jgi:hypothetical protein